MNYLDFSCLTYAINAKLLGIILIKTYFLKMDVISFIKLLTVYNKSAEAINITTSIFTPFTLEKPFITIKNISD